MFRNFENRIIFRRFSDIQNYHLFYTTILSLVPLCCGLLLLLLISVFSNLNLYFLESNGLILNDQIREAYYRQVEAEMFNVGGYLVFQVVVTATVSFLVMRWATAPFNSATQMIKTAMDSPENLRPASRWLSESPAFDRIIWLFCLRVKSGGENQVKDMVKFGTNLPFFAKFILTFGSLSISTGYVLSIIMDSVYRRVIDLALQLVKSNSTVSHYFLAQQDILKDANNLMICISMFCYFLLGLQISRYMATMLFVFSRSVFEDKFPITLRNADLYTELAETLNKARNRIL
jgi:hypothetical protein